MNKRFQASVDDHLTVELDAANASDMVSNTKASALVRADFFNKRYLVRINGSFFDVVLKDELRLRIDELGLAAATSVAANELKAPMPGLIVNILTEEGASIRKGDGLIILEAMKMENKLTSPLEGKVRSIRVAAGEAVEKGTVLIEFEQ